MSLSLTLSTAARPLRTRMRRLLAGVTVSVIVASLLVVGGVVTSAEAATGHVTGTVFRDFNQNGVFNSTAGADGITDLGLKGITATAYDADGNAVGSAVSTSTGDYDILVTGGHADGTPVRVQFSGYPAGFFESTAGTGNGSSVQFTTVGAVGVNFALHTLNDYSKGSTNPIITTIQANGLYTGGSSSARAITIAKTSTAIHTADTSVAPAIATFGEVGAVFSTATESLGAGSYYIYAAAVLKRHSGFGPQGIAGLYRLTVTVAADGTVTRSALNAYNLATAAAEYGTVTRDLTDRGSGATRDAAAFAAIGKVGIGGISYHDGKLYVVNLNDKRIYVYDTAAFTATAAPAPTVIDPGLTSSERPWALTIEGNSLYLGVTNTANVTTGAKVLATSLSGTPAFTNVLNIPLNYERGVAWHKDYPTSTTTGTPQAQWHVWSDDATTLWESAKFGTITSFRAWAQPILSGLAFDDGGNLVIGFADRFSLQGGASNYWADQATNASHTGVTVIPAGDTLFAGKTSSGFALENNGSVTVTTAGNDVVTRTSDLGTPVADGQTARRGIQGPGGREFFEDSVKWDGTGAIIAGEGVVHDETTLGSVGVIAGTGQIVTTSYDSATSYNVGGNRWMSLIDGHSTQGFNQYTTTGSVYFAKSGGLGGLSVMTLDAPIQIGNRVWLDADHDGIQGADEPAIVGATVRLLDAAGTTVLATTTTDSTGQYFFSSTTTSALVNDTSYQLEFVTPSGAVTLSGAGASSFSGLLGRELVRTTPNQGSDDTLDSDADLVTGRVALTTGAWGQNDHSFDAGFFPQSYAVGDVVWIDRNGNGLQDSGESTLAGVTVTLLDSAGNPVAGISPQTTLADGRYLFDRLPAGSYSVRFSLPANYSFTTSNAQSGGAAAPATDSDAVPSGADARIGTTAVFTLGSGSTLLDASEYTAQSFAASQGIDPTWDAGVVPDSVSVGNYVWLDADRDGTQDAGELGIQGVVLTIRGPTGAAVTNVFGDSVGSVTTDAAGAYLFPLLPVLTAGQYYTVSIDQTASASVLDPYTPTTAGTDNGSGADDSSTGSSRSHAALTTAGASDLTLDFGFVGKSYAIGDLVWVDANRNGVQDAGEASLAGVTVTLLDAAGDPVPGQQQTTLADGRYLFDNLPAGSYRVQFALSASDAVTYQFTTANEGTTTGALDSDAVPVSGTPAVARTGTIVLGSSNTALTTSYTPTVGASEGIDPTWDAGVIVKQVSVGNRVWLDTDRDGLQDVGETGIDGVVLGLYGPTGSPVLDGSGDPVTATTAGGGLYLFSGLPALVAGESYTVKVETADPSTIAALAGLVPTLAAQGADRGADSSTGEVASGDLTVHGASDLTLDFGYVAKSYAVGDIVWIDYDADGIQDAGEPPLAGVGVALTNAAGNPVNDVLGQPVASTTTDTQGRYRFDNLPAGDYRVAFTLTSGQQLLYGFTTALAEDAGASAPAADSDADATTGITAVFTLNDSTVTTAYTAQSYVATQGINPTIDAGVYPKSVSVGNYVWLDANDNGTQDSSETGIEGVVLTIAGPGGAAVVDVLGNAVGSVTTDASGAYLFTNLPPLASGQSYTVSVDTGAASTIAALAGLRPATVNGGGTGADDSSNGSAVSQLPLSSNGASDLTLDFGYVPSKVSVGNFVWIDTDRDGIQDAGEPGLPGVTVELTGPGGVAVRNVDGVTVGPQVTDSNGAYSFTKLPPLPAGQSYTVTVNQAASATALAPYVPTAAGVGSDRALDSSTGSAASGNLTTDGASDTTLDFGYVLKSYAIGDVVWIDRDADGIQDAGEPHLAGVTVTLLQGGTRANDITGTAVADVVTGASGAYQFDQLAAGSYTVQFTLPSGYRFTTALVGAAATDSNANVTTGRTGTIVLDDSNSALVSRSGVTASQGIDPTWDAGVVPLSVSVGNLVWVDTDGDGIQDSGEPGLPGVWLVLTDDEGDPVTDVYGTPVASVQTDANGLYSFVNLPPLGTGTHYTVTVDQAASASALAPYKQSPAGVGTDRAVDSSSGSADSGALPNDGDSDLTLDFGYVPFGPAITIVKLDADGNDANTAGTAVDLTAAGGTVTLEFTVRNTGDEALVGVVVSDAITAGGGTVTGLSCTFPDSSTGTSWAGPFAAGASFDCTATLAGVTAGVLHTDVATVVAAGRFTGTSVTDTDPYNAWVSPRVSVGNLVWEDLDRDGIQDAGEPGIPGVWVVVSDSDGNPVTDVYGTVVAAVQTDANGQYSFTNLPVLPSGEHYTVSIDTAASASVLAPFFATLAGSGSDRALDSSTGSADSTALTTDGASDTTLDFGYQRRSYAIGDVVWIDTNRDGIQDAGEPGLQGVTVTLLDAAGTAVPGVSSQTTDADGRYLFDNLRPGNYRVQFTLTGGQQAEYRFTTANVGAADDVDSDAVPATGITAAFTLGAGTVDAGYTAQTFQATEGVDPTHDAGVVRRSYAIGDLVWLDANENGIQDGGESVVSGTLVELLDSTGTVLRTTTTGTDGRYLFDELEAGDYGLRFTPPAGYYLTPARQGGDAALDSDADATTGRTPTFTLGASSVDPGYSAQTFRATEGVDSSWDAGLIAKSYAIGDRVWFDTNRNGVQDPGEASVAGVIITLFDADGVQLGQITTGTDGRYLFDLLPAGEYELRFALSPELAARYQFTSQENGAADSDSDADRDGIVRKLRLGPTSAGLLETGYTAAPYSATGGVDPTWDVGLELIVPALPSTGVNESQLTSNLMLAALLSVLGGLLVAFGASRPRGRHRS